MSSLEVSQRSLRGSLRSATALVAFALAGSVYSACSAESGAAGPGTRGGTNGGSSSGGAAASAGSDDGESGSGASGGTSNQGTGGTISIDASTPPDDDPDADCGGQSLAAESVTIEEVITEEITELAPADVYVMMDKSGSMNQGPQPWDAVKNALIQFVQSPESAGMWIGIQYFPLGVSNSGCTSSDPTCACIPFTNICWRLSGASCNVSDYAKPDVPIQLLPGAAQAMIDSLNRNNPSGGTPTHPALQGAMQYAMQHASTNGGRKTTVVLATDGAPNDCSSTADNVAQVAATGLANNPSIQTFVVGIGNIANLNLIAQAGGTGQALIVDPANAGQQFLAAMNQIRGTITQTVTRTITRTEVVPLECEWVMPAPQEGQEQDPQKVNVRFTSGGTQQSLGMVPDQAACATHQNGWYYDQPTDPTKIIACPDACDAIKAATDARIDILVGCQTTIAPPT